MGRFDLRPVFLGHWKGLSNDTPKRATVPDWRVRLSLILIPIGVLTWGTIDEWKLPAASALLSALALLSAGILSVFAQLASLRAKLAETDESIPPGADTRRDGIDESVAHLLTSLILSLTCAAVIVVGMNVTSDTKGLIVHSPWSAIALAICSYIFLTFLVIVPKLYNSYSAIYKVRGDLDGFHRDNTRRRRVRSCNNATAR